MTAAPTDAVLDRLRADATADTDVFSRKPYRIHSADIGGRT
ncbi:hypothetical protein [Microbacterium soli]